MIRNGDLLQDVIAKIPNQGISCIKKVKSINNIESSYEHIHQAYFNLALIKQIIYLNSVGLAEVRCKSSNYHYEGIMIELVDGVVTIKSEYDPVQFMATYINMLEERQRLLNSQCTYCTEDEGKE